MKVEQIELTKEEAHDMVVFLSCYIKGILLADEKVRNAYKKFAFLAIQKLLPLCEWEEGEEKCMVTSLEQLERFL